MAVSYSKGDDCAYVQFRHGHSNGLRSSDCFLFPPRREKAADETLQTSACLLEQSRDKALLTASSLFTFIDFIYTPLNDAQANVSSNPSVFHNNVHAAPGFMRLTTLCVVKWLKKVP